MSLPSPTFGPVRCGFAASLRMWLRRPLRRPRSLRGCISAESAWLCAEEYLSTTTPGSPIQAGRLNTISYRTN